MLRRVFILLLGVALSVSAELWVNAIRDPGAELGQEDWETEVFESTEGAADSARVSSQDSTRAYEGQYSFITDTQKNPGLAGDNFVELSCFQMLPIPKAVNDIDSCSWYMFLNKGNQSLMQAFHIYFRSESKMVLFHPDIGGPSIKDTLYPVEFPTPDSGEWIRFQYDLNNIWINAAGWPPIDSISEVGFFCVGALGISWLGQEISWDNIKLQALTYYDYASESIDSEPWSEAPTSYTPVATFTNQGKLDDFSAWVYAEIYRHGGDIVYKDSVEVSIPSDGSEQITFETYQHEPDDAGYSLRVFPMLENDEYSEDDTLELVLVAGIEEEPTPDLVIRTRIAGDKVHFILPEGVTGELCVYDASGRQVYAREISQSTEIVWDARDVASGVYFYKFNSPSFTSSDKLILLR